MILLCGIPSESPLAMVAAALHEMGAPVVLFNQREVLQTRLQFELAQGKVTGVLCLGQQCIPLATITGVYIRLMDEQQIPELRELPETAPARLRARALHDAFYRWLEITPARVVNRTIPMGSNSSKPYQAQLIRQLGFAIPETLITNDPRLVREFHSRHQRVIYKSMSSMRSIVQQLTPADFERLEQIRWCPTQFQTFIEGENVRVHVVGREVFATRIISSATDYRYARQEGLEAELVAIELADEWAARCIQLADALHLPFAGIDLKITPEGAVYCFEVNPSPGFSFYEAHTNQPIARAVATYLVGNSFAPGKTN